MKRWLNVTIYVLMLASWVLFFIQDHIIHLTFGIWVDAFGALVALVGIVTATIELRSKR